VTWISVIFTVSKTLIDDLISDQRSLRPVERFSRAFDEGRARTVFRELIPLSKPAEGEQYAFAVDLDRCTGCKACVAACHSLNGLDEEETWREVGTLIGGTSLHPRMQTVTSACHHCVEPGCLEGCPVLAYEKDAATGIVRHLDDQCIGCSYCVLKCPYEVPKYSKSLGIVRKCDMCHSRLAVGESPACVQACPTSAISITIVKSGEARRNAENGIFLPDSPDPSITIPTTVYSSRRPLSDRALSADHFRPAVQHTHWPLVFMLVLTQSGVGTMAGAVAGDRWSGLAGCILFLCGLFCSALHLGRPLKAWRAFLGWKTSWLSREILAFGGVAPLMVFAAGLPWVVAATWAVDVAIAAVLAGFGAVVCSAWIYHDTGRAVWRGWLSFGRFLGTTAIFACMASGQPVPAAALLVAKIMLEGLLSVRGMLSSVRLDELDRSAILLRGPLRGWLAARIVAGFLGVLMVIDQSPVAAAIVFCGEILERALFFKAGVPKRMPGH